MGKLEGWLGRHLRPRLKLSESIKAGLEKVRGFGSGVTDLADVVRIESDNRSLRQVVRELQAIITETKRADEDPGTIHLTRRPGEGFTGPASGRPVGPPPPMPLSGVMTPDPKPEIYMGEQRGLSVQEQILQGYLDDARRKLATSDSVGVQLKTRLQIIHDQLLAASEALAKGNSTLVEQHLFDARRTTNIGLVVRIPLPVQGAPYPGQREAVHFDDEDVDKPSPPTPPMELRS